MKFLKPPILGKSLGSRCMILQTGVSGLFLMGEAHQNEVGWKVLGL